MNTPILYPIIPRPLQIETEFIKGSLYIEGCIDHNYIKFRFVFSNPAETAPVSISLEAIGKKYTFNCIDINNVKNEAETIIFSPEFFIGTQFEIIKIEPLVKFVND